MVDINKEETIQYFRNLGLDIILLKKNDKRPVGSWKKPTTLPLSRLNKWEGNYGAVLGDRSHNIIVVDLDQHSLFTYFKNLNTLIVKTPNKGYHIYLKSKKSQQKLPKYLFKPIDIQGNGSYVVIPPSSINKKSYEIVNDADILEVGDVEKFVKKQLKEITFERTLDCREGVKQFLGEPEQDFGKYTQYNCPFHDDTDTPSLTVYEDGMKCFGCGWAGSYNMFLEKHQNMSPVQIKEHLESKGYTVGDELEFNIETKKEKQIRLFSEQIDRDFVIVRDVETEDLFLYVKEKNAYIELTQVMLSKLIFEEYGQRVSLGDSKKIMDYFVRDIRKESKDWVAFRNKLVNVETLETQNPTSKIFTKYFFDFNWNPDAYSERFEDALKSVLVDMNGNEDAYHLFFEMFGYLFTNHQRHNKMFFLTGGGANGKSTLMDLLKIVFGKYMCSVPFNELSGNFGKETLLHKLVNVLPDLSNKSLSDTSDIKAITGGDSVAIDRKYKSTVNTVLPCKFVATGNYLPKTKEDGYAFFRRVLHIELTNTFKENPEKPGEKKIDTEIRKWLPEDTKGIEWLIYKSILSYSKVKENGWTTSKSIEEVQEDYTKLSNPVLWVSKRLFEKTSDFDTFYTRKELIQLVKKELRRYGLKEPGNNNQYYETFRDLGGDDYQKKVMGRTERGFIGLEIKGQMIDLEEI